eukprot:COSAG05_NODE_193_length_14574_cov_23.070812_8_plen_79_part_00
MVAAIVLDRELLVNVVHVLAVPLPDPSTSAGWVRVKLDLVQLARCSKTSKASAAHGEATRCLSLRSYYSSIYSRHGTS